MVRGGRRLGGRGIINIQNIASPAVDSLSKFFWKLILLQAFQVKIWLGLF
jgi:hypothetical protein